MIWTLVSVLMCLALTIKLTFFSDDHRGKSRLFYRGVLFLSAVYAAKQVIWFVYYPDAPTHPVIASFHMVLFVGAFLLKPTHLPWNTKP